MRLVIQQRLSDSCQLSSHLDPNATTDVGLKRNLKNHVPNSCPKIQKDVIGAQLSDALQNA
jgi:hypothetical protein